MQTYEHIEIIKGGMKNAQPITANHSSQPVSGRLEK